MLTSVIIQGKSDGLVIERNYEFQSPIVNLDELGNLRVSNHPATFRAEQFYGDDGKVGIINSK